MAVVKWEYKVLHVYWAGIERWLNSHGADGWEVCGLDSEKDCIILKRPRNKGN